MGNFSLSALSEEHRRIQYLAEVAQENAERLTRGETALETNTRDNRERWNTAQVSNHEGLFSIQRQLDSTDVHCRK